MYEEGRMPEMRKCKQCGSEILSDHILIDDRIPGMTNGDKIVAPRCRSCFNRIDVGSQWHCADRKQRVFLISGACGSGKSTLGKMLEEKTGYVHIDGDAVSKCVNWDIRNGYLDKRSAYYCYDELLDTIQVVLQLGYSVIATYVFSAAEISRYEAKFAELGVACDVCVLKTDKDVCIERDKLRECWTAGESFIGKWYDDQKDLAERGKWAVIDNSSESAEETLQKLIMLLNR